MKHYFEQEYAQQMPQLSEQVAPFVRGSYRQGGEQYALFSLHDLVSNPEFLQVAA